MDHGRDRGGLAVPGNEKELGNKAGSGGGKPRADAPEKAVRRPAADLLVELAEPVDVFHTPDGGAFADVEIDGHRETWKIRSSGFRRWLTRQYFKRTRGAPNTEALQSALGVIEARAQFEGPERAVHVRVGHHDGKSYLDLGNHLWQAVEIAAGTWKIVDRPPIRFRRPAGLLPLPEPIKGGAVITLRQYLNVKADADFILAVSWLFAALRGHGPYPVLALAGEQGSAKSTFAAVLRSLVDPNAAPLRALPREDRDLFVAAGNAHVLAFDNLSVLPPWTSDTLARLATGAGFAVRQNYTDTDEILFAAERPIILNGIEDVIGRADLADRTLFLTLSPIARDRRRAEKELLKQFEVDRPAILGALLTAVAHGLQRLPQIHLPALPRMADFALFATACETALWEEGTFAKVYDANINEAVDTVLDADSVALAVRALMNKRNGEWRGTASALLANLSDVVDDAQRKSNDWPKTARSVAGRLRRAATFLRRVGIDVQCDRAKDRRRDRIITLALTAEERDAGSSARSTTSDIEATAFKPADGRDGADQITVQNNPLISGKLDGADGADADCWPESGEPLGPGEEVVL